MPFSPIILWCNPKPISFTHIYAIHLVILLYCIVLVLMLINCVFGIFVWSFGIIGICVLLVFSNKCVTLIS
jgi:hypothetical protein